MVIPEKKLIKSNRRRLKASDVSLMHHTMSGWLEKQLSKYDITNPNRKYDHIIILTHHAPSFSMLDKSDLYSMCYGTNCEHMMKSPVKYWISGHTHTSKTVVINDVVCLSNCMGYPNQRGTNYDSTKYITFK